MTNSINFAYLFGVLAIVFISMVLHELVHGLVAYKLGDNTAKEEGRLSLNPLKHIDPFMTILLPLLLAISGGPIFGGAKPVPFNPRNLKYGDFGVAVVAIAGPLTNLFIAFLSYAMLPLFNIQPNSWLAGAIGLIVIVNLGFFVFNMIPIPPLDGSRVLYALAPEFVRRFMEFIEGLGVLIVLVLVLVFGSAFSAIMSGGIGWFLHLFQSIFGV